MKENANDFWQHHSARYLEMALDGSRHEKVTHPDARGKKTGDCGDSIEFFLSVKSNQIEAISFETDGCLNTNACANTVAFMCEGKFIEDAWEITPDMVIEYLETLPFHESHCAELAVGAFYLSLADINKEAK